MPRSDPIARSKNVEDGPEDATSAPKSPTALIASTALDTTDEGEDDGGDLLSAFGVEYPYGERQLERYVPHPCLYRERLYAKQHLDLPKRSFLHLPAELRLEIYRHCLQSPNLDPIQVHFSWDGVNQVYHMKPCGPLAVNLLRTCKLINVEAVEVLYGENCFHLQSGFQSFAMFYVPNDLFRWVRELEMIFPMVDDSFDFYDVPHQYSPGNICLISTSKHIEFAPEQMANQVLRHLLGILSSVPCLRQLSFIIPPTWTGSNFNYHWQMPYEGEDETKESCMRDDCLADLGYGRTLVTYLFHSGAWKDLEAFFHLELPFHVSITRIYKPAEKWMSQRAVDRLFKNARRCGIWDQREALEDGDNGMNKPSVRLGVEPDEIMRDMGRLFQETG